jgi:hypothetical protein
MTKAAAILAAACMPAIVLAQTSLTDFARGAAIRAEGGSIYRILLPEDVYDTATRPDLGDLRVLNAAGDAVPHSLRTAPRPAESPADSTAGWRTVPSFPMTEPQRGASAKTQIRLGPGGTVLEVSGDMTSQRGPTSYLVDVSRVDEALSRVALAWQAAPDVTFLARVSVLGSDDLNSWRTLVPSAALAQLQRDGSTLTQSEIELPAGTRGKYLRISWPRELAAVTLTSVRVRPPPAAAQAEIRWRTLPADGLEPSGAARYDARALLPIQFVDVEFVDSTDTATVTIRSRATPSSEWIRRHRGLFYSLRESDSVIRNSPMPIAQTTDRYWSAETSTQGGWKTGRAPRLKIGWHPHELVFLAQGAPPYTLVYGSARAGAADAPVGALLATMDEAERARRIRPATLDAPRILGGADALKPALPLKQVALWSVLIVAVGALAVLAMRLLRDA